MSKARSSSDVAGGSAVDMAAVSARADAARAKYGRARTHIQKKITAINELTSEVQEHCDRMQTRLAPSGSRRRLQAFVSRKRTSEELEASLADRVRHAHNPLQSALTVVMVCTSVSLRFYEAGEIAVSMRRIASRFSRMAVAWLDDVIFSENNWFERWTIILTSSTDYYPMDCIELSLDLALYDFLNHPQVMRFVDRAWMGSFAQLRLNLAAPDVFSIMAYAESKAAGGAAAEAAAEEQDAGAMTTRSFINTNALGSVTRAMIGCSELMTDNFSNLVDDLMNPTYVINSPMARFVMNFIFFISRVMLQHQVLKTPYRDYKDVGVLSTFTSAEVAHFLISIGFFLYEIQEVKTAYVVGGISKVSYWGSFWNQLDWLITAVFFSHIALKITSVNLANEGRPDDSEFYFDASHFVLAFNSIILWVRMLDYLSFSATLGPAVRVLGLMVRDLVTFSILFSFILFGFGSAFHEWFGDQAAFATLEESILTLFEFSLGEFRYQEMRDSDYPFFGPLILTVFLFTGTIMLLNLLIAILSSTYERIQTQSLSEFRHGKTRMYSALAWDVEEVMMKGVPLPIALSIFRVVTTPAGRIFGGMTERLLNMTLLCMVVNAFLAVLVLAFCLAFYFVAVGATFTAGLLMVLVDDDKEAAKRRMSNVAKSEATFGSISSRGVESTGFCLEAATRLCDSLRVLAQLIELLVIYPPFVVLQTVYLLLYKLPALMVTAAWHGTVENWNVLRDVMMVQVKHGRRGRHTKDAMKLHRNKLWKKLAAEAVKMAPLSEGTIGNDDLMKWSEVYALIQSLGIPEAHYCWSQHNQNQKKTALNGGEGGDGTVDEDGEWDEDFVESSIYLHHAFFYSDIPKEGEEVGENPDGPQTTFNDDKDAADEEEEDEEDEDFIILYRDFITYIVDNQRPTKITNDETDVLPFVRACDIVAQTHPHIRVSNKTTGGAGGAGDSHKHGGGATGATGFAGLAGAGDAQGHSIADQLEELAKSLRGRGDGGPGDGTGLHRRGSGVNHRESGNITQKKSPTLRSMVASQELNSFHESSAVKLASTVMSFRTRSVSSAVRRPPSKSSADRFQHLVRIAGEDEYTRGSFDSESGDGLLLGGGVDDSKEGAEDTSAGGVELQSVGGDGDSSDLANAV
jgi:hypothetical protein